MPFAVSAPALSAEIRRAVVLQRSEDKTLTNIKNYSSFLKHYDEDFVNKVIEEEGLEVRGHHSGKPGDGMNSATQKDLKELGESLKKRTEKDKKSKKKPQVRQQVSKTWYEKAELMADTIFEKQGLGGLGDYTEYLDKQLENEKITDKEYDELVGYYMELK